MEKPEKKDEEINLETMENGDAEVKAEPDAELESESAAETGSEPDVEIKENPEVEPDSNSDSEPDSEPESGEKAAEAGQVSAEEKISGESGKENRENKEKNKGRHRKALYIAAGCLAGIVLVYLGIAFYFRSHYLFHTTINGHEVSGKTVAQAEELLKEDVGRYELLLEEIDGSSETIEGKEAGLAYESAAGLQQNMDRQNILLWPEALFTERTDEVDIEVSYDEDKLAERISSLNAVTGEQTPAVSAYPKFDGEKYVIEPEQYGTAIQRDILEERIAEALSGLEDSFNLEEEKCYADPAYTSDSSEVKAACDLMNQYCSTRIVYPMTEEVVIDASVISGWISVDDKMQVVINEDAVRKWLEEFGDKYDTVGTTRTFRTPAGRETTVSGGTYGWSINEIAEFDVIIDAVKNGKILEREPEYYIGGTAATHAMPDWGNTYVDVDLSAQHMWYVVDGSVALETDVVTGLTTPDRMTPEGTYSILEKGEDQVLIGATDPATGEPSYRTPVNYWMRVTWSGIGLHDATWQPSFGGNLNQIPGRGSHGCINMPLDQAAALYGMLEVGTPVVIHY